MTIDPKKVAARLREVQDRIASSTDRDVTVVAVTKGFGIDAVEAAAEAGIADIGESYAQELAAKYRRELPVRWHFIGGLQRNKVRRIADAVSLWQSVDRLALVSEIAKRQPGGRILAQVNVSGAPGQGGCEPEEVAELVAGARQAELQVEGLMAIGAQGGRREVRDGFDELVSMADELGLEQRSIGMSGDYELAVEAGATMVRLGTTLFGPRPPR